MARPVSIDGPSRALLEALPGRVVLFLRAAATQPGVRAELARTGFDRAAHQEGTRLLCQAIEYRAGEATPAADPLPATAAFAELDAWAERNLSRFQAAVERLHPEHAGLLSDLEVGAPSSGAVAVAKLLERLTQLEKRAKRGSPEHALLATLTKRGLTQQERQALAQLVEAARSAPAPGEATSSNKERRDPELLALYAWYRDWSLNARAVIRRKDYLISLGLSERKRGKGESAPARPTPAPET